MKKELFYSWNKTQSIFSAIILVFYLGIVSLMFFYKFGINKIAIAGLSALSIFLTCWILFSHHKYSIENNRIKMIKYLFLKKEFINISDISSLSKEEQIRGIKHPLFVHYVALNLKNKETKKIVFFSEENRNKFYNKLVQKVKSL